MSRKKLLFMYLADSSGIQEEGFHFSTKEQFCVKKDNDGHLVLKKDRDKSALPDNFWGEKISDVNLLIGDNGSGKTTIMRAMSQWISCFSEGALPRDKGIVVLQENDSTGYVAFDDGDKLTITADSEIKLYDEEDLRDFFQDVRLIYFSNSMTELNAGKWENLSDYSLANRIKEANGQGTAVRGDIIANYNRWEFNRQINEALEKNDYPIKYLCMEIRSSPFGELRGYLPEEKMRIADDLEELWEYYFGGCNQKTGSDRKLSGYDLLRAVFVGVLCKLIRWEKENTLPEEKKFVLATLEEILQWEQTQCNASGIDRGQLWAVNLLKDLISDSKKKYGEANKSFQNLVQDNINEYAKPFIELIVKYIKGDNNEFLKGWKDVSSSTNEGSSTWQWGFDSKNKIIFREFWEAYGCLAPYVENVSFYWDASSGERNWASLFSSMHNFEEKDTNLWLLLDEPDIAFHPEWQRKLIKKITETCNSADYGDRSVQVWISTHSPIMLSDVPGNSVIYLKEKGKYPPPFEETFAQNIYVLFNSAFVLENGIIGDFATGKILDVLEKLQDIEKKLPKTKENLKELSDDLERVEKTIGLVAEPVFQLQMKKYLLQCKKLLRIRLADDKDKITRKSKLF